MGEREVNTVIHVHTREVERYWFCLPICCHQLYRTKHRLYCHQLLATWPWFFFQVNRKKKWRSFESFDESWNLLQKGFKSFALVVWKNRGWDPWERNRTEQKCKESSVTSDVNNVPVFVFDFCFCLCFFTFSLWSKK